jgi:flagellar biosynthesis/type III secretory pathway chaperone
MQPPIEILKNLFYDKIMLYRDLVELLRRERDLLIRTDIDALWEVSDRKQSIVGRIGALRGEILNALSAAAVDHDMDVSSFRLSTVLSLIPGRDRLGFKKPYLCLVGLKSETRKRSQENKLFIEQSLAFLDELITVIANTDKAESLYDEGGCINSKGHKNLLLHREV